MKKILTLIFLFLVPLFLNLGCCSQLKARKTIAQKQGTGVIMLSFGGYYSSGDKWGNKYWIPSRMSTQEKETVKDFVRKYFNLWDVIVTENESVYRAYPKRVSVRVVVTLSVLPDPDSGTLGLGYTGTVFDEDSTPVLVNPATVDFIPQQIATVIAHEVGHALGLKHQMTMKNGIYSEDTGDSSRQPIMGYGTFFNNRQWYVGMNKDFNFQNDTMWISRTWNGIK